MPKIIKLGSKDDLGSLIKQIKTSKETEVILEVEKDSPIMTNNEAMRLVKKTAEVLGKKLRVQTSGEKIVKVAKITPKVSRSDIKPQFSDIMVKRPATGNIAAKLTVPKQVVEVSKKVREDKTSDGSRLEIEMEGGSSSRFSKIFILCLVVLVVAVFGLAVLLPKSDIKVYARSEPITRDFEITVDRSVASANRSSMQIPGVPVSKEVSQTKTFPTTGVKVSGSKTGGEVTIFNNTGNTIKLNAATTTLVVNGKKYFFTKDVSGIRSGVPNTGIAIAAENGGADYNLPANTRFQVVNAALGDADVYAQNPTALGGGTNGAQTKILSQEDIDKATESLIADVVSQAESDLTASNGTRIRVLDSGVKKEILAKTANKDVGAEVDTFSMTLIAKVSGLGFKEDDVATVVVAKINEVLSSDKYLIDGQREQYSANFKSVDLVNEKGVLDVHFETIAAYNVDTDNLAKVLAGKNESEIQEILLSKPEIDKVEVKFWPEWFVHKAPKFNGKINIETALSQ
jgi:hypothetical protein